jgi:predicted nucleotidyltransferase
MSSTCVTLSNPVDEMRELTLAKLAATAESQGLNVLLLGAFARDLLFWHMHNIECHRATMDVDVVVQLKDWAA